MKSDICETEFAMHYSGHYMLAGVILHTAIARLEIKLGMICFSFSKGNSCYVNYSFAVVLCVDYGSVAYFSCVSALSAAFGKESGFVKLCQKAVFGFFAADHGCVKFFDFARYII